MKREVVAILFKSKVYAHKIDFKIRLDCGHVTWLWGYIGNPFGSLQTCNSCSKDKGLKVLK